MRKTLASLFLISGCATNTGEPDTAGSVADAAGGLAKAIARTVMAVTPGVTEATDGLDSLLRKRQSAKEAKAEQASEEERAERLGEFCVVNPCIEPCPELINDTLGILPKCPSRGGESGETFLGSRVEEPVARGHSVGSLRDRLKREESFVAMITDNHICHGHYVQPGERFPHVVDEAFCDRLLDMDISDALGRAMKNLGRTDDAAIELCFWRGCNQWPSGDTAAIKAHLIDIGNARAHRLLRYF